MIKPDCIVVWPQDTDFPLFRYNLQKYKEYFNKIIIGISDNGTGVSYIDYFKSNIPGHVVMIPPTPSGEDWRSFAVNYLLTLSDATHVFFTEPDFLVKDARLFEVLFNVSDYDFLYYQEAERMHPACALTTRHLIDKTSKDFGARPPAYDHFGLFFTELLRMTNSADLETVGLIKGQDYYHMQGLTQNYHAKPYHKPNEFLTLNRYAMRLPHMPQQHEFFQKMKEIDQTNTFFLSDTVMEMIPRVAKEAKE